MSNLHRIQWIDSQIRSNRFPNCNDIAEQFCISSRQASRDIEYLKYSLSAPIEYSAEKRGYYYTEQAFVLPAIFLGEQEKQALTYLADRYRACGGDMTDKLAALFEKLTGKNQSMQLPNEDLPVYKISKKSIDIMSILKGAVANRKKVKLIYLDNTLQKTQRLVHPYIIHGKKGAQYVHAFCELRRAERDFRIDRIQQVALTEQSFSLPDHFDESEYAGDVHFTFRQPYKAIVLFDQDRDVLFPNKRKPIKQKPVTIPFHNSEKLYKKLFSMGKGFTILTPEWLKEKFKLYLQELLKKNR